MIREQVKELREFAQLYRIPPYGREVDGISDVLDKAANLIETLSAKLAEYEKECDEEPER